MADKRRWLLVAKPLPHEVAVASRDEEIRCLEAEILEKQMGLAILKASALPQSTVEYIPVYPDDPRYSEASEFFAPSQYTGTWKFLETKT